MRRAYGSQTIEIATRLTDVTCVTEPRELTAQGTPARLDSLCIHFVCILLENARAGRGRIEARGERGAVSEVRVSIVLS